MRNFLFTKILIKKDKRSNDKRKEYLDERQSSIDIEFDLSKMVDKSLLTLSSAALGFSLTFFDSFRKPHFQFLLIISWIIIAISILLIIVNMYRATQYQRLFRKSLDESEKVRLKISRVSCEYLIDLKIQELNKKIKLTNKLVITSFSIGIFSLILFLIINYLSSY